MAKFKRFHPLAGLRVGPARPVPAPQNAFSVVERKMDAGFLRRVIAILLTHGSRLLRLLLPHREG